MIYRHYKGGRYLFLMTALESTNGRDRCEVVIYVSLDNGQVNVRDKIEFHEPIIWPDRMLRPRFCPENTLRLPITVSAEHLVELCMTQIRSAVETAVTSIGDNAMVPDAGTKPQPEKDPL